MWVGVPSAYVPDRKRCCTLARVYVRNDTGAYGFNSGPYHERAAADHLRLKAWHATWRGRRGVLSCGLVNHAAALSSNISLYYSVLLWAERMGRHTPDLHHSARPVRQPSAFFTATLARRQVGNRVRLFGSQRMLTSPLLLKTKCMPRRAAMVLPTVCILSPSTPESWRGHTTHGQESV